MIVVIMGKFIIKMLARVSRKILTESQKCHPPNADGVESDMYISLHSKCSCLKIPEVRTILTLKSLQFFLILWIVV